MKSKFKIACVLLPALCIISCTNSGTGTEKNDTSNMDTTKNKMQGDAGRTVSLFNGNSLSGWHAFNKSGENKKLGN